MNSVPKMHRPTAILAAVFIILSQVMDTVSMIQVILSYGLWMDVVDLVSATFRAILLIVILLRGKKDSVSGILFLLLLCYPVMQILFNTVNAILVFAQDITYEVFYAYGIMVTVKDIVKVIFYGFAAGKCLRGGKVSSGKGEALFGLIPTLGLGCVIITCIFMWKTIGWSLSPTIPHWIGLGLMGVSFFFPAKNTEPEL